MNVTILLAILGLLVFIIIIVLAFFDHENGNQWMMKKKKNKEKEKNKDKRLDYNIYIMSTQEKWLYTLTAAIVIYAVAFLFYRNHILSLCSTPFAFFYPKLKIKEMIRKRKKQLNIQFKEALYALSSSLTAGKSIEMAFKDALNDLQILYPDSDTDIIIELQYIIRKLEVNETVEEALLDLANRSQLEDIQSFADVFVTCKRTGGNLVEVIKNTARVLGDKLEFMQELDTLLAQRKFEQKILGIMPILLIVLLSWVAGDYMEPVFHTVLGRFVMTIAMILLVVSYFISKKIMDIEV